MERLEADLGQRANVLRVSIHTDLGRQLGQRYWFQYTPTFIVFDGSGHEQYRGPGVPTLDEVLKVH